MKKASHIRPALRFRKWCRKAYAMFASIGKCVTIGCIKKSIADAALGKQGDTCVLPAVWISLDGRTEEEEEDTGWKPDEERFLIGEPSLQIIAEDYFDMEQFFTNKKCRTGVLPYSCPAFY